MSRKKQNRTEIYSLRLSPEERAYFTSVTKKLGLRSTAQLILKAVLEYGNNKAKVNFYNFKLEQFPTTPDEQQHLLMLQQSRINTLTAANVQLRARLGER